MFVATLSFLINLSSLTGLDLVIGVTSTCYNLLITRIVQYLSNKGTTIHNTHYREIKRERDKVTLSIQYTHQDEEYSLPVISTAFRSKGFKEDIKFVSSF